MNIRPGDEQLFPSGWRKLYSMPRAGFSGPVYSNLAKRENLNCHIPMECCRIRYETSVFRSCQDNPNGKNLNAYGYRENSENHWLQRHSRSVNITGIITVELMVPGASLESAGFSWKSLEIHAKPWKSMTIHRTP